MAFFGLVGLGFSLLGSSQTHFACFAFVRYVSIFSHARRAGDGEGPTLGRAGQYAGEASGQDC
jgi:hypothetical protein